MDKEDILLDLNSGTRASLEAINTLVESDVKLSPDEYNEILNSISVMKMLLSRHKRDSEEKSSSS